MPSTNIVAFTLLQKPVQDFVNNFLNEVYNLKINYPDNEKDLYKIIENFDIFLEKYTISEQFFLVGILLSNEFISTRIGISIAKSSPYNTTILKWLLLADDKMVKNRRI